MEDAYVEGIFDPWSDDPFSYREPDRESLTIREALNRFLERKREDGRAKSTLRTYEEVMGIFSREIGEDTSLDAIAGKNLRDFIRDPVLAKATQHKRYGHLRTFFRWCIQEDLLTGSPLEEIAKPKKRPSSRRRSPRKSFSRCARQCRRTTRRNAPRTRCARGRTSGAFRSSGLLATRGCAAPNLTGSAGDTSTMTGSSFTSTSRRTARSKHISLNRKARAVLEDVEEGAPADYVFRAPNFEGKEREARYFRERASRAFRKARKKAGIERKLSFHSLRHGFCTWLAEAGKPLQVIKKVARHADVETSMIYVHMANEHLKSELDDVF